MQLRWIDISAVLLPPVAVTIQGYLHAKLGVPLPLFLLSYPAVFWAAWIGGMVPGLIATTLAAVGVFFFFVEPFQHSPAEQISDILAISIFAIMGVSFSVLIPGLQKRRAEAKASEDQKELTRLMRLLNETQTLAHVGGWEIDIPTGSLYWTEETYRIHDTSPTEYVPTVDSAIRYYAPASVSMIQSAVNDAIEVGKEFSLELDLITAKKRQIRVVAQGKTIFANGKAEKVFGAFRDVTESKRAEERLRQSEETLRFHFDHSPFAIVEWDSQFVVRRWTGEAEHVFG